MEQVAIVSVQCMHTPHFNERDLSLSLICGVCMHCTETIREHVAIVS